MTLTKTFQFHFPEHTALNALVRALQKDSHFTSQKTQSDEVPDLADDGCEGKAIAS